MPNVWSWYQSVDSRWLFGYWKTANPGPHVAVRIDQARHEPAVGRDGLRAGHLVVAQQAAVVDPQVALFTVRQHDAPQVQRRHGSTLSSHARHPATRGSP